MTTMTNPASSLPSSPSTTSPRRSGSVMNIFGRMNPLLCLGSNSTFDIADDDVIEATKDVNEDLASNDDSSSSPTISKTRGDANNKKRDKGGKADNVDKGDKEDLITYNSRLACMTPLRSRYQPDDKVEHFDYSVDSLERVMPEILDCISSTPPPSSGNNGGTSTKEMKKSMRNFNEKRSVALQKLYELTKKGKEYNRVPLVCTAKWDVVGVLSNALMTVDDLPADADATGAKQSKEKPSLDEDRRLICWTLNNLSIPYENKATMALGADSSKLMRALTFVIQSNLPESYLCCICFMNLTFLADAIRPIALYVDSKFTNNGSRTPPSCVRASSLRARTRSANVATLNSGGVENFSKECGAALENPSSLIRTIERMMKTNSPFLLSTVLSVQGEAIRWACGFIRNVTYAGEVGDGGGIDSTGRQGTIATAEVEEICTLISRTEIPRLIVLFVNDSPHPTVKWTKDSLEDISLSVMCNMAQFASSREALKRAGALQCLEKIEGLPGIHGYRARAVRCSLGALPMQFG